MTMLLHLLSYVGMAAAFVLVTLSLASFLYWLAELIEEHSSKAKVIIQRMIYTVIGLHVLFLVVDRLPIWHLLLGIACHLIYLQNLKTFPFIKLTSATFIASCILVFVDHLAWFFKFGDLTSAPRYNPYARIAFNDRRRKPLDLAFADVATFFGICVWLVPFALFISLSASDFVLPYDVPGDKKAQAPTVMPGARAGLLRMTFDRIYNLLPEKVKDLRLSSVTGRKRRDVDGLLGTPTPGTPNRVAAGGGGFPFQYSPGRQLHLGGGGGGGDHHGSPYGTPNGNALASPGYGPQQFGASGGGGLSHPNTLGPPISQYQDGLSPTRPRSPLGRLGNQQQGPTTGIPTKSNLSLPPHSPSEAGSGVVSSSSPGAEILMSTRPTSSPGVSLARRLQRPTGDG